LTSFNRTLIATALGCTFVFSAFAATGAASAPASASASAPAVAAKGANHGPAGKMTPGASAVQEVAAAAALARYGDANKDPLALVTAAKMLKEASSKPGRAERVGKAAPASTKTDLYSADAVLARAKTLAADRPDLQPLIAAIESTAGRGATNGPGRIHTVVDTRDRDTYRVAFDAYEPARVLVSGDGSSDLDLYVYDENDHLICKDDDDSDDMVCAWTPIRTAKFKIVIVNRGIANEYTMVTN
jgi:hypothetical protein